MKKSQLLHALLVAGGIILAVCLVIFPLFLPGFIQTDDADWMVIRLSAFYQSFSDGQFPVRFLGRLNYNFGYPVANFLYPGFLYIGTFLHLLKIPFSSAVEIIIGGSVIVSGVFLFLYLRSFFSLMPSFFGMLSFLFAPYVLFDIYKRGSVGEILSLAIGMIMMYVIEKRKYIILPLLVFFIILSHNTMALFFGIFFLSYIIFFKRWGAVIPSAIGVVMASFFVIPALFERSFIHFSDVTVANPFSYFKDSHRLIFLSGSLILCGLYVWIKRIEVRKKEYVFFFSTMLISLFFASIISAPFWRIGAFSSLVQFPYRFLAILSFSGSFLVASFFQSWKGKKRFIFGIIFLFLCGGIYWENVSHIKSVVREEGYYTTNEATTTVADEYMPKWVIEKPQARASVPIEFFSGKGTISLIKVNTKTMSASVYVEEEGLLQINKVYYPGWGGMLDGKPVELSYDNKRGLIMIPLVKGNHKITLEFRETAFRFLADIVSAFGFVSYGMYLFFSLLVINKGKKVNFSYLSDVWT